MPWNDTESRPSTWSCAPMVHADTCGGSSNVFENPRLNLDSAWWTSNGIQMNLVNRNWQTFGELERSAVDFGQFRLRPIWTTPHRVGPRRVGTQNFARFFPPPVTIFVLFFSLWVSVRLFFSLGSPQMCPFSPFGAAARSPGTTNRTTTTTTHSTTQ